MRHFLEKHMSRAPKEENHSASFKTAFFRLYDRKIASGEVKFSEIGISKEAFTALCITEEFSFTREEIIDLCIGMKLNRQEALELSEAAGYIFLENPE